MKKIIHANNIEYLRTLKDNSVDSVVTDPPYGISFMGKKWDYDVPSVETWQEVFRVLKPGGHMLVACGTRTQHRMAVNIEDAGFEIRDIVAWVYGSGFPKSMDVSKAIESTLLKGSSHSTALRQVEQDGDGKSYTLKGKNNGIMGEDRTYDRKEFKPSTEQAKQWNGWGTALKPSMELWTLARKPLDGTVAQNILEYGVGGLNIDGCRVAGEPIQVNVSFEKEIQSEGWGTKRANTELQKQGRFPANFIHDGSEEVEALFPDSNGGTGETKVYESYENDIHFNASKNVIRNSYADSGSASRFFYVAKASQEERNFGLYDFPSKQKVFNGQSSKPSKDMKGVELKFSTKPQKNIHPTVKPIDLMRYLVRMITPPNGICLDPYLGSGTTAIACEMEKFNYIGIELDEQYIEIAKARVDAVKDYETSLDTKTIIKESIKEDKEKEAGIQTIFDFMEMIE